MIPFLGIVKPYIYHYGYFAVFFGVFFESLGLPLPGETLIIVAGLLAAKGVLGFKWIVVLAALATFIANQISYITGYFGGRNLIIKYGSYVFINEKKLQVLENFFKLHGAKVVLIARFIIGMRQFNGFIAGTAKMSPVKFMVFNMLGAILWVIWWTGLAYFFGKKFAGIFIEFYFLIGVITLVMLVIMAIRISRNMNNGHFLKNQPAL